MNAKAALPALIDTCFLADEIGHGPDGASPELEEMESLEPAPAPSPATMDAAWRRLLAFVAEGRADQGAAYERVRARLVQFFAAKGELNAEELADATFDRLVHKLTDELVAEVRSPIGYVLRFARFIHLERIKSEVVRRQRLEALPPEETDPAEQAWEERRHAARLALLERCLGELPAAERALLVSYYTHDGRARIASRQKMSRELGINPALLRTRVSRLRVELDRRVRALADEATLG